MHHTTPEKKIEAIPTGDYCYRTAEKTNYGNPRTINCPFWSLRKLEDGSDTGHCSFLDVEDSLLLWDQVKICGENIDFEDSLSRQIETS